MTAPQQPPEEPDKPRRPWILSVAVFVILFLVLIVTLRFQCSGGSYAARSGSLAEFVRGELRTLQPGSITQQGPPPIYTSVQVLYATDRARTGKQDPAQFYGVKRGGLELGRVTVTVPQSVRPGELAGPKWYRLEFRPDPAKHVVLQRIEPLARETWTSALRAGLDSSTRREGVLVIVHGFHEQFEHAARRTAQLAYDLNFHGVPVVYSWPTKGTYEGYPADEASAEWTAPHFRQFLELLASASGDRSIHVLAHSMGSQVVIGALGLLREDQRPAVVGDLILAAPDMDADVFEARAGTLRGGSGRVTLYASSRDRALQLSQLVHQGRRAGQSGPPAVVPDSMDTIDASNIDTDLIGHGYFSENKALIDDLFMLIRFGSPANDRNLRGAMEGSKPYFMLP